MQSRKSWYRWEKLSRLEDLSHRGHRAMRGCFVFYAVEMIERIREHVDDVSGDRSDDAVLVPSHITGQAVNINAKLRGLERGEMLGDQCGDHPGEDVARPPWPWPGSRSS